MGYERGVDSIGDIDKVIERLNEAHLPCAPILTIEEMVNHPHMRLRSAVHLGENHQNILNSVLGLKDDQLAALDQQGILYANLGTGGRVVAKV